MVVWFRPRPGPQHPRAGKWIGVSKDGRMTLAQEVWEALGSPAVVQVGVDGPCVVVAAARPGQTGAFVVGASRRPRLVRIGRPLVDWLHRQGQPPPCTLYVVRLDRATLTCLATWRPAGRERGPETMPDQAPALRG